VRDGPVQAPPATFYALVLSVVAYTLYRLARAAARRAVADLGAPGDVHV
jgi:hypothetical protein